MLWACREQRLLHQIFYDVSAAGNCFVTACPSSEFVNCHWQNVFEQRGWLSRQPEALGLSWVNCEMKYNPLVSRKWGGILAACFLHFMYDFLKCNPVTLSCSQSGLAEGENEERQWKSDLKSRWCNGKQIHRESCRDFLFQVWFQMRREGLSLLSRSMDWWSEVAMVGSEVWKLGCAIAI